MDKKSKLFVILGGFFITNAIIAEFIGIKIFSLEKTLGFIPFDIKIFGEENLSFQLTCGVLLWPVVFIMTDIINEYYGKKGVRLLSYIAASMIAYAFLMVFMAINTTPAEWWINSGTDNNISNMQTAYQSIFGQGMWIIVGSLAAFLIGQLIDVWVFHFIKKKSGNRYLWLRSTGSTLVSQFFDSFIVLFIAFYIGNDWSFKLVMAICIMNYLYKFLIAIILTPLLYILHHNIDKYLGKEQAEQMIKEAELQYEN
ncbi:MAG: queuosine precursor transporter [Bacteroidota bacterium]|nr:queuosine precursor transporter [Bacteroidota bacterium]